MRTSVCLILPVIAGRERIKFSSQCDDEGSLRRSGLLVGPLTQGGGCNAQAARKSDLLRKIAKSCCFGVVCSLHWCSMSHGSVSQYEQNGPRHSSGKWVILSQQNNSKSTGRICVQLGGKVDHGPVQRWSSFWANQPQGGVAGGGALQKQRCSFQMYPCSILEASGKVGHRWKWRWRWRWPTFPADWLKWTCHMMSSLPKGGVA